MKDPDVVIQRIYAVSHDHSNNVIIHGEHRGRACTIMIAADTLESVFDIGDSVVVVLCSGFIYGFFGDSDIITTITYELQNHSSTEAKHEA